MNTLLFVFGMAGSGQGGEGGNPLGMFLPMILIFGIMYLLIFRPQAKRQKEHKRMLEEVKKGDKILTAGGIYGTVEGLVEKEGAIIIKVDDNVKLKITRSSVAKKLNIEPVKK